MLLMLMYHRILPYEHPEAVSGDMFRRHLDFVQSRFRILTPEDTIDYIQGRLREKRPCVSLSFDDGWLDNWLFATGILKERGLRAAVAVSAGTLREEPLRNSESESVLALSMREAQNRASRGDFRAYINNSELKAMQDSGVWRIEAHGTQHVKGDLGASVLALPQNGMNRETFRQMLRDDVDSCCSKLEALTGIKPAMFFWPWGHYSSLSLDTVADTGLIQFTVSKGAIKSGDRRTVLPRIGVSPRFKKFRKNLFVFRHPVLAALHDLFHTEKVCFDDLSGDKL